MCKHIFFEGDIAGLTKAIDEWLDQNAGRVWIVSSSISIHPETSGFYREPQKLVESVWYEEIPTSSLEEK